MKIYSEYKDYQEYVDIQTETNKAKIDVVWVSEIEVIQLYNYIANKYSDEIHYVMCHGARNGTEVKYFTESLPNNWVVEGNDISETANAYELHQWDMQNYNEDWKQKFTIQYTNSFDHVYDPQKTLKTFMKQCTDDGSVFIQWTENLNNEPLASDPLSINLEELAEMCNDYASVVNTLDTGMNRTVRYKGTDEILRQLKIYYLELKR
tara:strand:+ start:25 stop:645 length:621 start_codon:yes stop_codon:yes gene_type:complete